MDQKDIEQLATALHKLNSNPDWLSITGIFIATAAAKAAFLQLQKINHQIQDNNKNSKEDHERTRREKVIDSARFYVYYIRPEHAKVISLIDNLDDRQIVNLKDGKEVLIPNDSRNFCFSSLVSKFPDIKSRYDDLDTDIRLTHSESMHLRFLTFELLNIIECSLLPWHLGIADEETTKQQFSALIDNVNGKRKLQVIREILGNENFPATISFKELLDSKTPTSMIKSKLG